MNRIPKVNGSKKGFTLIELLVVIAIIAILASMLLPALAKSKTKAQGILCMGNNKQLMLAVFLYAQDHQEWLPPNLDNGGFAFGWVRGSMGNANDATNTTYLTDPKNAKLAPYMESYKIYRCPADKSTVTFRGVSIPRVRSVAMSQAVGTDQQFNYNRAVAGPWLDGNHGHTLGSKWLTFGKLSDFRRPSETWVMIDEDEQSINDAGFAVAMYTSPRNTQMIDWPGTYHNNAATFAFGDGHAEVHKWLDARTKHGGNLGRRTQANSVDIIWMADHTSELINQ